MAKKKDVKTYERIMKHKPKSKDNAEVKHISFDYETSKYRIIGAAIYDGLYPSVAAILRHALDNVVDEYQRKNNA